MDELTPSEDLMVEALLARHRLGEPLWTFEKRHRRIAQSLLDRGLVRVESGVVENTIRVWPTSEFIERYATYDYRPPRYAALQAAAEAVLDRIGRRCDACLGDPRGYHVDCQFMMLNNLQMELDKLDG